MNPTDMLLSIARPLATFALLSAIYTVAAWRMGRLAGVVGLLAAWAGGVALAAAYGAGRLYQPQGALGWQAGQEHDTTSFFGAATFMAVCLGATTFVVGWRQATGAKRLGVGGVVAGTAASVAGFFVNMLMFGFSDLAHFLGQQ